MSDRWWRGADAGVTAGLRPGARVLEVGCGDGAFVAQLAGLGFDAVGVDPRAPAGPRLHATPVEDFDAAAAFDAACAFMSLHHCTLDRALAAIARLLVPGGRLYVYELAWEQYDERAAAWLSERDPRDHSVARWRREHDGLHTGETLGAALGARFDLDEARDATYLWRMLPAPGLESEEQRAIAAGELPALGRVWAGTPRPA